MSEMCFTHLSTPESSRSQTNSCSVHHGPHTTGPPNLRVTPWEGQPGTVGFIPHAPQHAGRGRVSCRCGGPGACPFREKLSSQDRAAPTFMGPFSPLPPALLSSCWTTGGEWRLCPHKTLKLMNQINPQITLTSRQKIHSMLPYSSGRPEFAGIIQCPQEILCI